MPAPPLRQVEDAARQLVEGIPARSAGPESLWQIDGVATAGKGRDEAGTRHRRALSAVRRLAAATPRCPSRSGREMADRAPS